MVHIVCATTVDAVDRDSGVAELYLERFDQAYCCYGGADLVVVAPSSVAIRLNQRALKPSRSRAAACPSKCDPGSRAMRMP